MDILMFIIRLAGATFLLLFAVRMVRTGIERSFGARFKEVITQQSNWFSASLAGLILAVVLQSSTAVTLLASGFAGGGMVTFPVALALVLGGDLGSALVIQILSFQLEGLVPVILAIGGWLYVKVEQRHWRQVGRILMGIAFILIALRFLREAMDPIQDSSFLPAIANYLAGDFLSAFLIGASLAFVMHSSVAAILMCVTLVQIGAIPFSAGVSLVLGANLGSAAIAVWLTRSMEPSARQVPFANLTIRGTGALLALFALHLLLSRGLGDFAETAQMLIYVHIVFNGTLILITAPFGARLEVLVQRVVGKVSKVQQNENSSLKGSNLSVDPSSPPAMIIADLKRELLRMSGLVDQMFQSALDIYRDGDVEKIQSLHTLEAEVNASLSNIREYVIALPSRELGKKNKRDIYGLMEYAIRLESAGDVVAKRMTELAAVLQRKASYFSPSGWQELERMHQRILENLNLSSNVLISDDLESARLLSLEKTALKRCERDSREKHMKRLRSGQLDSLETSDIHLETLRAMREFNSHISAIAYPLLYQKGQLLETRLILSSPATEVQS